jgi:hypothetical protein
MCRHLTDATATYRSAGFPTTQATWNLFAQNRTLNLFTDFGVDNVTAPAALVSANAGSLITPDGVQYMSSVPGYTVLGIGDSLTQGLQSSTGIHSWAVLSCLALSTPSRPVTFWNQGVSGTTSDKYWANGYTAFKACKPDVVTIPVWTPNDAATQAAADTAWSRATDFADYAARNGAVPVLMGPVPWLGITAPWELARLSARTRMLNAASKGMAVLDWENVIGTGASPNTIQPALLATAHPNDAGYALMDSAVFRPVLANILRA